MVMLEAIPKGVMEFMVAFDGEKATEMVIGS